MAYDKQSRFLGYDFFNHAGTPYGDYLQQRQFETSIRFGIREQTKTLIATDAQLAAKGIEAINRTADSVNSGFSILSRDLSVLGDRLESRIGEVNSTIEWGFSEMLLGLGRMNDSLSELVRIAKSPAQTWSLEQYDIARDELRRGLYPEALISVLRAINGYGANPGYRSEFRFHFLLGVIRLGSFSNASSDILSLSDAEKAFCDAARYARNDFPAETARALLGASRAAYAVGNLDAAQSHIDQAIKVVEVAGQNERGAADIANISYQKAKISAARKLIQAGIPYLERAIRLNRIFSVTAAGDGDFQRFQPEVDQLIGRLREESKSVASSKLTQLAKKLDQYRAIRIDDCNPLKREDLEDAIKQAARARDAANTGTYFGYLDAQLLADAASASASQSFRQFQQQARQHFETRLRAAQSDLLAVEGRSMPMRFAFLIGIAILLSFVLGFRQCSEVSAANERQAEVRKAAGAQMMNAIRARGYDPVKMSIEQGRELGFRLEDLPPADVGSAFGTWFAYTLGGILFSLGLGYGAHYLSRGSEASDRRAKVEAEAQFNKQATDLAKSDLMPP